MFDFASPDKAEATMLRRWEEFRSSLENIKTLDEAKQFIFLKVFDDLFVKQNGKKYVTKRLNDICKMSICRGSILRNESNVSFERFLPNSKYITADNRFSPPHVEWLYLAISNDVSHAKQCCIHECRAAAGDYFGICEFSVSETFKDSLIVDLTFGNDYSYDGINGELVNSIERRADELAYSFLLTGDPGYIFVKDDYVKEMTIIWLVKTYTKMMSEQLFRPVTGMDKGKEYLPFHWLSQYFIDVGFSGIIYKSTVYNQAKNMVLFNKHMLTPKNKEEFYIRGIM